MTFIDSGLFVIGWALFMALGIGTWRLGTGPTTLDRMLGFDMITITGSVLVIVFSAATRSTDYIEFVFVLSGLGFLTTVAYFYYLMQLDPDDDDVNPQGQP